jgi:threonine dehydratase
MSVSLQDIQAAQQRIGDKVLHTPCPYSLALSRLCGC